jgi:hypothetical protein
MAATTAPGRDAAGTGAARAGALPELAVRLVIALLALAVAGVHVADQGGITAFDSPDWLGWSYRVIEVGGVLTALVVLLPWSAWLGWAAGVLLGTGPFLGYIASRSVGVPGDHADIGNWGYWLGTVSLIVEAAVVIVSAAMLLSMRQRSSAARAAADAAGIQGRPGPGSGRAAAERQA